MRDPKRIDEFCNKLAQLWHKVPDWRFSQLMENMLGPNDFFYMEDNELIAHFKKYINEIVKKEEK